MEYIHAGAPVAFKTWHQYMVAIQGQPLGIDTKERPGLTRYSDKSTKNWCSLGSWVVEIYAWSTIWNFFDLTGPQQPPSERVPCISKKLDFWWSIPQKITIIDYFLYQWWSDHQNKKDFWGNWALEAVEASEVAEAAEVNEAGEVSKAWKITTNGFSLPGSWIK